jgi:hypothetical protein
MSLTRVSCQWHAYHVIDTCIMSLTRVSYRKTRYIGIGGQSSRSRSKVKGQRSKVEVKGQGRGQRSRSRSKVKVNGQGHAGTDFSPFFRQPHLGPKFEVKVKGQRSKVQGQMSNVKVGVKVKVKGFKFHGLMSKTRASVSQKPSHFIKCRERQNNRKKNALNRQFSSQRLEIFTLATW